MNQGAIIVPLKSEVLDPDVNTQPIGGEHGIVHNNNSKMVPGINTVCETFTVGD